MGSDPDLVSSRRRSSHLLPRQCIICRKDKKITERYTRKKKTEKLTQCETLTASKLLLAAEMRKDEQILLHIRGQDLVALEVRYHYSCYQTYTKFLSKKQKEGPERNIYQEGNIRFCKSVVERRVIQNREVLRLKKLLTLFCKCVKDVEGVSIQDYKSWNLKMRLQKTYPFLRFMKSSHSNESDLVFVEDLDAEEVVEEIAPPNYMSSESPTDGAVDGTFTEGKSNFCGMLFH